MKTRTKIQLAPIPGRMPENMLPEGTALVLEGGGLRGFYSAGVFEAFMDAGVMFPYIAAVSAGAANVLSYISGQPGRNRQVLEHYVPDKRYLSKRNYFKTGSLFGMDFVFREVPRKHVVFDWDAFNKVEVGFFGGAVDCNSGRTVWFGKDELDPELDLIIASCSVPVFSPIRRYAGLELLDGGVSDPIPIEKSLADGNEFHVVVLTRNEGYRKKPFPHRWFLSAFFRKYPNLIEAICTQHETYNRQLDLCERLEREGKAVIIRPILPLKVKGTDSGSGSLLLELHDEGREEGSAKLESIMRKLDSITR